MFTKSVNTAVRKFFIYFLNIYIFIYFFVVTKTVVANLKLRKALQ